MFLLLFFSIQEHLIHSCRKVMHFVVTYPLLNCPPQCNQTPGSRWQTNRVSHGKQVAIEGLVFLASLVALKSSDIDVILGMDWLSRKNVVLDCKAKSVKLTHPSGHTIKYTSPSSRTQLHSLNVLPLPDLEDIPVVHNLPDV